MNTATFYLGIIICITFLIIDILIYYFSKHNYLKNYTAIVKTTFKICELVLTSYIFAPVITLFMHPTRNSDIQICFIAILCPIGFLWVILLLNTYEKEHLESYTNNSVIDNQRKVIKLIEKNNEAQNKSIEYQEKLKTSKTHLLHKQHI